MNNEPKMPIDWDDHVGWEAYYRALPSNEFWYNATTTSPGSFSFDRLGSLIDDFQKRNWLTLWFPGCGFSPLPRAFAFFGFTVYATDIAASAVEYQNNNEPIVRPLLTKVTCQNEYKVPGSVTGILHDFRTPLKEIVVDAILNVKSIQGLSPLSMASALRSHFAALRLGGIAFFDTMNVQGERRDQLETALVDAGFYVPLYELNQWYRKALLETGIPHMFVLGTPMIPQRDDYPYVHKRGSPEYNRDVQILRDLTIEYRSRMKNEYEKEQKTVTEQTKLAHVIYSTG